MSSSHDHTKCPCNHEVQKMQAISAIVNPNSVGRLEKGVDLKEEKMLLFQSLIVNNTLGYDQFEIGNTETIKAQGSGNGKVKGCYEPKPAHVPVLKFQSKLASVVIDGVVNVYGVLEGDDSISLMSPVVMPLPGCQAKNGIIAACGDGKGRGWLYFQKNGKVYQRSLAENEGKPTEVTGLNDVRDNTDIVAFWDGSHRWVAYQQQKSSSIVVHCIDNTADNVITNTNNVLRKWPTKLAVAHAKKDGRSRIFVYMTNPDSEVMRSVAEVSQNGSLMFGAPENLANKLTVADYTWYDVEVDKKEGLNLIYAVTEDDADTGKITGVPDSWEYEA